MISLSMVSKIFLAAVQSLSLRMSHIELRILIFGCLALSRISCFKTVKYSGSEHA